MFTPGASFGNWFATYFQGIYSWLCCPDSRLPMTSRLAVEYPANRFFRACRCEQCSIYMVAITVQACIASAHVPLLKNKTDSTSSSSHKPNTTQDVHKEQD